jgi:hypothetical protein
MISNIYAIIQRIGDMGPDAALSRWRDRRRRRDPDRLRSPGSSREAVHALTFAINQPRGADRPGG